jgi:hypothetical protein
VSRNRNEPIDAGLLSFEVPGHAGRRRPVATKDTGRSRGIDSGR